ncbi:GNAT family N-acetyltransferase [Streptomyces sp. SID13031]|uniref:GNAT family N-acetyltransferase n=1 Tax=Streptomyces sp. SID13031 TaxID=2706046 RepID=UPI0013CAD325|nr:GNAT family N-acetyltransferase [Streptomyces sp. SID13031]NEA36179.1 GNAT family N-acetyltransferase [Streptomyces sp. SID13031]
MSSPKAPPVSLRPLTAEEYDGWKTHSCENYAADIGPARRLDPAAALEAAYREFDTLLTDGPTTENQLVWLAYHEGTPVGSLWISTQKAVPFVYLIEVRAEQRGKGYGRSIMLAGEEECRSRGYDSLALNVFGSNSVATGLYDSLGYEVVTQEMRKTL